MPTVEIDYQQVFRSLATSSPKNFEPPAYDEERDYIDNPMNGDRALATAFYLLQTWKFRNLGEVKESWDFHYESLYNSYYPFLATALPPTPRYLILSVLNSVKEDHKGIAASIKLVNNPARTSDFFDLLRELGRILKELSREVHSINDPNKTTPQLRAARS